MTFQKGHPFMGNKDTQFKKGHKHPPEVLAKMKQSRFGYVPSLETRKKQSDAQKRIGTRPPSAKGLKRRPESIEKLRKFLIGRPRPDVKGEKCHFWKGGITSKNSLIRTSIEYKFWRRSVFERDSYQCVWGGKEHGSKLHADHIKPFALFPELRFAIDNGRTLCVNCHKTTDSYLKKLPRDGASWVEK